MGGFFYHSKRGLVSAVQVGLPRLIRHEPVVISCQTVQHPMCCSNVRVVVGSSEVVCFFFRPCGPSVPIDRIAVCASWHGMRLIRHLTSYPAISIFSFGVLYTPVKAFVFKSF